MIIFNLNKKKYFFINKNNKQINKYFLLIYMVDINPISPKQYRKLLSSIYHNTQKEAKIIKDNFSRNSNPICPKEPRCISAKTRKYNLTQAYYKKMEEKPEKKHKRQIPIKKHINMNLSVMNDEPRCNSIKIFRNIRKNQTSAPKIDKHKKYISLKDSYKNFYLDNFNSIKQNQDDINNKKRVRIIIYI